MSHKYRLLYRVEKKPDGVAKADVPPETGACDAMLLASIIYPEDGSLSIMFVGHDGRTDAELEDREWFKVWSLLSARLAKSTTLGPNQRELCQLAFECVCAGINSAKAAGGGS